MTIQHWTGAALTVAAFTVLLSGCSDGDPVGIEDAAQAAASTASQLGTHTALPVKQVSSGVLWPIGYCDEDAGVVRLWVEGSGTATHVGQFWIGKSMCLDPATGVATDGDALLTAANGDEIHMVFDGHAVGAEAAAFDFVYVMDGGSGRFADAEGELEIRTVLTSASTWSSSGSGWMSY